MRSRTWKVCWMTRVNSPTSIRPGAHPTSKPPDCWRTTRVGSLRPDPARPVLVPRALPPTAIPPTRPIGSADRRSCDGRTIVRATPTVLQGPSVCDRSLLSIPAAVGLAATSEAIPNGAAPQPDEAWRLRPPIQGQAHAGTRGQGGRPPPLAAPMNCDHARSAYMQVRCAVVALWSERYRRYAARAAPETSNLTQNSSFAGSSFAATSEAIPRFDTGSGRSLGQHQSRQSGRLSQEGAGLCLSAK